MNGASAVFISIAIFALGAYSGLGVQAEQVPDARYDAGTYLPRVPQPGDKIEVEGLGDFCTVEAVQREWVKCAERPTNGLPSPTSPQRSVWHNLYNGHTQKVFSPRTR